MVERVHLTPEFVDAALPPERGERWIGDADIQGFGLRLWTTRSGAGKAFAIRTFSSNGITVRRTYDPKDSSEYQLALLLDRRPSELGACLASARRWASSEITRLKGIVSYLEKSESIWVREANRRLRSTVQEATDDLLEDMRRRRLSESYIISVDKLLSIHLPATIRSAPLADLTPNQIARALSNSNPSPSALRLVQRFIGHIFETAAPAEPSFLHFARDLDNHIQLQRASFYSGILELEDLTEEYYKRVFQRLEIEDKYWQQAMCVRLFFEFWTPFYRLMGAQWDGIIDRRWYPYPLSERRLNLRYGGRIDERISALLERVRSLGTERFGPNSYWFPSQFGRKFDHIRTVDTIWRNTLCDLGERHFPLREVALNYRRSVFHLRSMGEFLTG